MCADRLPSEKLRVQQHTLIKNIVPNTGLLASVMKFVFIFYFLNQFGMN